MTKPQSPVDMAVEMLKDLQEFERSGGKEAFLKQLREEFVRRGGRPIPIRFSTERPTWAKSSPARSTFVTSSARPGRPPKYDHGAITKIARDLIAIGVDDYFACFVERVCIECEAHDIKVPSSTRRKEILRPIWDAARAQVAQNNYRPFPNNL
jgi:hypothetical protein